VQLLHIRVIQTFVSADPQTILIGESLCAGHSERRNVVKIEVGLGAEVREAFTSLSCAGKSQAATALNDVGVPENQEQDSVAGLAEADGQTLRDCLCLGQRSVAARSSK
jgi:hypothetical protein